MPSSLLNEDWLRFGAALGIGLLIGLERERNPATKAGARTFALVALFGAYARDGAAQDSGTTTVIAALV